ncbi:hypothetical protein BO78DRAFT_425583 [Aspergillus sclerotiicarbonarius CBS 121057]|uniref:Uncharacterized protein n=1 Tax=Aspergillus sclerotiicarbonarius (strain CBS 121057 / IBT 28362) TaxID=1448318 RepID=A0A319EN44_ASPSB|nr:hypothetical protein BO78DRAFT_425583 [Aspergillus sclerotiicarbonarius CBS 121057]
MPSRILDFVPDMVRQAALRQGVANVEVDTSATSMASIPSALKEAYRAGNYQTIQEYNDKSTSDMNPIYENIHQNQDGAFFKIHNESDNRDYWMSISGDWLKPDGYMWCYCPDSASSGRAATTMVAQVGTFSTNAQTLGISNKILESSWSNVTSSTMATVLASIVGKYLYNRISGMVIDQAAASATAAAGEYLVEAGIISSAFWAGIAGTAAGLIVGAVVGAAAYYLVSYIADFVSRDYWVGVNIHNWETDTTYTVTDYYFDNAQISGGGVFQEETLTNGGSEVVLPNGMATTDQNIFSYVVLFMKNVNTIFEGLGVAFKVVSADGKSGFLLKYKCPRFGDNTLGLTGDISQSVTDYYNDDSTWASSGSYNTQTTISGTGVSILGTTNALSGLSSHLYQFDINIGLQPTATFAQKPDSTPQRTVRSIPERPALPRVPHLDETVRLPNGELSRVIAGPAPTNRAKL